MSKDSIEEVEWDLEKIRALPTFRVPNEAELNLLCELVEEGPLMGSDTQKESMKGLIEMNLAVEVVSEGEEGFYAATPRGGGFYSEFFDGATIAEAITKRYGGAVEAVATILTKRTS